MQSYPVDSIGFNIIRDNDSDAGDPSVGGTVIELVAGASLKIGEAVYYSGDYTVNKSATAGNNKLAAGIVVGGYYTQMQAIGGVDGINQVNSLVAADTSGTRVLVLIRGIYWVIADAAIAVGSVICLSTTVAGRVRIAAAYGGGALSGAPGGGVLSGAPAIGTLDATVDAGATPVTSSAANGAIATVVGAPAIGTLAVSAPTIGTLAVSAVTGDDAGTKIGRLIKASGGAADVRLAHISI